MGLSPEDAEHRPYAYVCVPAFGELIFRVAMAGDGVPGADVLQVWFDVGSQYAFEQVHSFGASWIVLNSIHG